MQAREERYKDQIVQQLRIPIEFIHKPFQNGPLPPQRNERIEF